MNISKTLKRVIMTIMTKTKNNGNGQGDRDIIDNQHPTMTFEQRIEVLLWGDERLGVKGIKGRVDRLDKLVVWSILISLLGLIENVSSIGNHSAGLISQIILKCIELLGGL